MKSILFLLLCVPTITSAQFEGVWYSSFTVMGQPMEMKTVISVSPTLSTTLYDSKAPERGLECDSTSIEGSSIYFAWKQGGLSYRGILNSENVIEGTMRQSGLTWEANFHRTKPEPLVVTRPQEPKPPFNYSTEEIKVQNGEVTLAGTLTIPKDFNAETPIIILASGSGPQNRDCEIVGHKPFWVIADHLSEHGIATVRFDDRGTGASSGSFYQTSLFEFGSDVETLARFIRKDKRFKKNPLGLAGHSEGGMHTLIAATDYSKIDFIIQLAAVGTSGREVLIEQQYLIPLASGETEELARWNQNIFTGICDVLELDPSIFKDSLQKFLGKAYDEAPASFDKSQISRAQFIMSNAVMFGTEWGRQFVAFETSDYLRKLKIPLLAINGEADIQVPAASNSKGFKSYEKGEVHLIEGLNHLFQNCNTCSVLEYSELEETISTEVLQIMTDWILDQR